MKEKAGEISSDFHYLKARLKGKKNGARKRKEGRCEEERGIKVGEEE